MEHLHYRFTGGRKTRAAESRIVGVVASGNLEVLIEPAPLQGACTVDIDTAANGFGAVWEAVVADFFSRHPLADVRISINDNGATPAIVALRLDQAVEELAAAVPPEPRA
ncbi:MAG TPA: malonate decarboxylase acyl carrier protein [Casimicrobiaceae bacterium]|jgi:malonate decarboxylase delta subunit|nr:malonate decarboxylase acyl carrier protein [Casimicrobiaceae bacterium]